MSKPWYQRFVESYIPWVLTGFFFVGSIIDTLSNVIVWIPARATYIGTILIVVIYIVLRFSIKRTRIMWVTKDGKPVYIKKLGWFPNFLIVGVLFAMWIPRISPNDDNVAPLRLDTDHIIYSHLYRLPDLLQPENMAGTFPLKLEELEYLLTVNTPGNVSIGITSLSEYEWLELEPTILVRIDDYLESYPDEVDAIALGGFTGQITTQFVATIPASNLEPGTIIEAINQSEFDYFTLSPGEREVFDVDLVPSRPGIYEISLGIQYWFEGEKHTNWMEDSYTLPVAGNYRAFQITEFPKVPIQIPISSCELSKMAVDNYEYQCSQYTYVPPADSSLPSVASPTPTLVQKTLDSYETIYFWSDTNNSSQIFRVSPDGNNLFQVGNLPNFGNPVISPLGDKIVFDSFNVDNWDIYWINRDGSVKNQLTDMVSDDRRPHWLLEENQLSFLTEDVDGYYVYLIDISSGHFLRLNNQPFENHMVFPSPDGARKIAYVDEEFKPKYQIEKSLYLSVENNEPEFISKVEDLVFDNSIAWSPDGERLAFFQPLQNGGSRVCIFNPSEQEVTCHSEKFFWALSLVWSPLGDQIAVDGVLLDTSPDLDRISEIFVFSSDGTDFRNVSIHPYADDMSPVWSPDGSRIMFSSNRDGYYEIFLVNSDGNSLRQLTKLKSKSFPIGWE